MSKLPRALGAFFVLSLALWPGAAEAGMTVQINDLAYEGKRHSVVLAISGPVTISTRSLRAPARLVVDLPAATLMSKNRELEIHDGLVKRVRLSQFKIIPPTVRVVIETAGAVEPLIAVQQTGTHLYITVASPSDGRDDHGDHGAHDEVLPAASPMAAPSPIRPSPIVAPPIAPSPLMPSPKLSPSPRLSPPPLPPIAPSPMATVNPIPPASPTARPAAPASPRRGEQGGETPNESLPGLTD